MKKHKHGNNTHQTHNALIIGMVAVVAIVSMIFLLPDSTLVGLGGGTGDRQYSIIPVGKQTNIVAAGDNYLTAPGLTIEEKSIAGLEDRYIRAYSLDCSAIESGVSIKVTGTSGPVKTLSNTCAKDYPGNAFLKKKLDKYPEGVVKFSCKSGRPVGQVTYCNTGISGTCSNGVLVCGTPEQEETPSLPELPPAPAPTAYNTGGRAGCIDTDPRNTNDIVGRAFAVDANGLETGTEKVDTCGSNGHSLISAVCSGSSGSAVDIGNGMMFWREPAVPSESTGYNCQNMFGASAQCRGGQCVSG